MKMAQPNVAREPSMDEILASIRRIIESNDQPGFGDEPANDYRRADDDRRADISFVDDETIVAEFHAEEERQVIRQPDPVAAPAQAAQPALSLADVAARVRAASERNANGRDAEPVQPDARPMELPRADSLRPDSPTVTARMVPGAAASALPVRHEAPAETEDDPPAAAGEAAAANPTASPIEARGEATASSPAARDMVTVGGTPAGALLSADVGAKVAQSFGALSEAVEAEPRRSFDEIAEEMLRPMLREWLDDNLPTLVERLVREEIERVARGPRR